MFVFFSYFLLNKFYKHYLNILIFYSNIRKVGISKMTEKNKDQKGSITFKYLPYSKCPHCGARIKQYDHWSNKWEETLWFECDCIIKSKTPTVFEETRMCKNTKEFKKLKKQREQEWQKVVDFKPLQDPHHMDMVC